MPLNETKLHQTNGHTPPALKRPNRPTESTPTPPADRPVGQVRSDIAMTTANTAIDRVQNLHSHVQSFTAAVEQQVDDAAFAVAASIATIPAQFANRVEFYLNKMGGGDAWSHLDRALSEVSGTPAECLLFHTDVFELPSGDLFEE